MDVVPSLRGLQAFDAAARNGSFAAAAEELGVSPAAISQLVRMLEEQLGRKLFHRQNRRIILTEAGREAMPRLSSAFDALRNVSRELRGGETRSSLTVSVPPSMLTGWLPMQIGEFIAAHGFVDISMRGEDDPVSFERDRIDLRLSYGRFHYPKHMTREIVTDAVYPVCAPRFLDEHGPFETPNDIARAPLIHTDWGPMAATYPSWPSWFETRGLRASRQIRHGLTVNGSRAALDLAEHGLGMVLGQGIYIAPLLGEGRLAIALDLAHPLGQPYCLTMPEPSTAKPIVALFQQWLADKCIAAVGYPGFRGAL
jgi:LysR family transcriptional regulator, glycine cleavage system transcriptional activator